MGMRAVLPGMKAVAAAALLVLAPAAQADAGVDYAEALSRMRATAGSVNGARLEFQAKQLQAEALRRIDGPDVRLSGFAGRVSTTLSVDTSAIAQLANPVLGALPPLPGLNLPDIPPALNADRVFDVRSLGVSSVWPLYTGGRLDAVKQVAAGRADEAGASVQAAQDEAATGLAQRYFTVQLARKAKQLRSEAADVAKEHQRMALKMERGGLIAKVERRKPMSPSTMRNVRRPRRPATSRLRSSPCAACSTRPPPSRRRRPCSCMHRRPARWPRSSTKPWPRTRHGNRSQASANRPTGLCSCRAARLAPPSSASPTPI